MSEIFISYASPDRELARALAHFLEQRSCSVFWDRTVPPGKTWDDVIERALREARAVIVLWSNAAVNSEWVKAEATDAAARRILVPAMIEKVDLPLRFRGIQAADLTAWDRKDATSEVRALLGSIEDLLGRRFSDVESPEEPRTGQAPRPVDVVATGHAARERSSRAFPVVLKALGFHLLLGIGLFHVDPRLKRKWIYVAPPAYAILDAALATRRIKPFATTGFGEVTFFAALVLYVLSFIDVGLTRYRRWKGESVA